VADEVRDRSNEEWLHVLRLPLPSNDRAIADLRSILNRRLKGVFGRRGGKGLLIREDIVQESLLKILGNLDSFRGESRFTTWATTIAVNLSLTELRRRRWSDVSLDAFDNPEIAFSADALRSGNDNPEQRAVKRNLVEIVNRAIDSTLTDRQRTVMRALLVGGMPLGEIARRLGTNQNALYKLMYDARRNLKKAILAEGLTEAEVREVLAS
jgi:RNA polymerase sigma-70 factor (ECF subfamily)